ncbi:MAG: hypothetical protein P1U30_04900 [Phycisphaerales bacterium]|nr:hypothetical protein [Phycisphaerales bacterium]
MRNEPTPTRIKFLLITMVGAAACIAPSALAQNALGDGRGLEANTRQGSNGRNYRPPSFEKEVAFRNAIATGNAPGGLSFRGDLGYQAPGEFAGELGSDALYSFRRDSLYSGLAGMGIRGTDALQYQFAMTTGSRVTQNLMGNLSVSRLGGATSASISGGYNNPGDAIAVDPLSQLREDSASVSGTLRSTSSYSSMKSLTPELLSMYPKGIEREPYGIVASPLMGLVATPMTTEQSLRTKADLGLPARTSYDDVLNGIRERAKVVLENRKAQLTEDGMDPSDNSPDAMPGGTGTPTDPAELQRINDDWINERIERLQRQVLGLPDLPDEDSPVEVLVPTESTSIPSANDGMPIRDPMRPRRKEDAVNTESNEVGGQMVSFDRGQSGGGSMYEVDPETLELIRGDGKRVTFLVDPTAELRNIYGEHMKAGENLLTQGRYFDAEERFTHALGIRRGDVTAQIGRMHAQIGAGLVVSASVNLQTLMSEHIEIVSRRYEGKLLPDEQRINELITSLRKRAMLDERPAYISAESSRVQVACGLMIAYLGYQIDDQQQMNDGFSVVRRLGTDDDRRLIHLLDTVWTAVMDGEDSGSSQSGANKRTSEQQP